MKDWRDHEVKGFELDLLLGGERWAEAGKELAAT